MSTIKLFEKTGDFAENKDVAKNIRKSIIEPQLKDGEKIILDFDKITSSTQSFVHALISEVIRSYGIDVLDKITFKNCNDRVKTIIRIVVEYVQDGIFQDPEPDLR